jgi:UDP-N-acetylglucosamine 3-dehydrogenase
LLNGFGDRSINVAVLGLGVMGRQHFRVLSAMPGVALVGVCDRSPEATQWIRGRSGVRVFPGWRELLAAKPDAVINALPTGFHHHVTRAFLHSGVHVLVEKPLATSVRQAEDLAELASKRDVVLMVGHIERFNPVVRALRDLISAGRLGEVVSVTTRRLGVSRPALPHVNAVLDLAVHDLDVIAYLLGVDGRLLLATGVTLGSNQLEDHADLVVRFGAATASIQANWITPVKIRRISLTGTRGFAEADYLTQNLRLFTTAPEVIKGSPWDFFAVSRESEPIDIAVAHSEPLRNELQHFIHCIRAGCTPIADAASAIEALALANAATATMRAAVRAKPSTPAAEVQTSFSSSASRSGFA